MFYLRYWYYFLVDYALAVLLWTMVGRVVLGLFVPKDWDNYIWRFFRTLTDPVLAVTARLSPSFMIEGLLPLVAVWYLIVLRIGWWLLLHGLGLAPVLETGG